MKNVSLKKSAIAGILFLLVACGDETTQINQTGLGVVASEDDLPECTGSNEGELAFVKGETSTRICVDGEWQATGDTVYVSSGKDTVVVAGDTIYMHGGKDTVYVNGSDFSCKTEELADKSGLKIICNGDSIGVVLNGAKGDKGEDGQNGTKGEDGAKGDSGAGCTLKDRTDTTVTVTCGDSTMVIQLGHAADGDTMTIKLDSLIGYTQKGPFLKGSSVYLYELNGSLNQTNGNFTSVIADDDGRYRFRTRGLKYPYAMVVVDGYYRNEVTGGTSDAPIRLRAITDVSSRVTGSANVNLLTHLEFDRVNSLATGPGKLKLKEAKHRAQAEILDAFLVDTNLVKNVQSEDMNVFGKSDADAALLAISVLMQGDGKAADLSVRLTELADDLVDGKWDGGNSAALKAQLADWAAMADGNGRLGDFRSKVGSWKLSDTVPVFEKFVRNFYSKVMGLGKCGSEEIPVGTVKGVTNPKSIFRDELYSDSASMVRFVCDDAEKARWRLQSDIEKDTLGWGDTTEGTVRNGQVNVNLTYVYQDNKWRLGTAMDSLLVKAGGTACLNDGDTSKVTYDNLYYMCVDQTAGDTIRKWVVASDIFNDTWEMQSECKEFGEYGYGNILVGRVNTQNKYVCEDGLFRPASSIEIDFGRVCVGYIENSIYKVKGSFKKCVNSEWKSFDPQYVTGVLKDTDGHSYKTVAIGNQLWMAENMNRVTDGSYCYEGNAANCDIYGRLYTHGAASQVCPKGWHLPDQTEFSTLISSVGGADNAGYLLKSTTRWVEERQSGNGSDRYSFRALPAGQKKSDGSYAKLTYDTWFWSTTSSSALSYYALHFMNMVDDGYISAVGDETANSVRCIQDN